LPVLKMTT